MRKNRSEEERSVEEDEGREEKREIRDERDVEGKAGEDGMRKRRGKMRVVWRRRK